MPDLLSREPRIILITRRRGAHVPSYRGRRMTFGLYRCRARAARLTSEHGSTAIAPCPTLRWHRGMAGRIAYYCDQGPPHAASVRVGVCKHRFYRDLPVEHAHCSPPLIALALQSACVIAMAALFCNGYEGLLLVLLAAQLALSTSSRVGFGWLGVQSLALAIAIAFQWFPQAGLLLTLPYFGFQLLMFAIVRLFAEERRMREEVVRAHAELVRMQGALAEKSRLEERLRIAQDMHDSLGHHLVTLSLNLEIAAHESQGTARATVRAAQALARALLQDVKEIVHSSKDEAPVDLSCEIQRLAEELPRPKLHVSCPPDLKVPNGRTSRAMLRAVQEIVTNTIRHGEAGNLWITIERYAR